GVEMHRVLYRGDGADSEREHLTATPAVRSPGSPKHCPERLTFEAPRRSSDRLFAMVCERPARGSRYRERSPLSTRLLIVEIFRELDGPEHFRHTLPLSTRDELSKGLVYCRPLSGQSADL